MIWGVFLMEGTSGMTPVNNLILSENWTRYWDVVKWPFQLCYVLFKSPQVQQKSKWIQKQTDREEEGSCNSLFNVEEQIFAWTCTWPVCSAEEQPLLYPIGYYSFISRELFIKTNGLCNPSSFQHPDVLVPSTDSQCLFVTHSGLWSWSLRPSALPLLFSYCMISLHGPPRFLRVFFEKAHKVNMEHIGTKNKEPADLLLCSKYLPAGLINLSLMSLVCGFSSAHHQWAHIPLHKIVQTYLTMTLWGYLALQIWSSVVSFGTALPPREGFQL